MDSYRTARVPGLLSDNKLYSCCLKKNLNACRPSENPRVKGKNAKTLRWDHRLQSQISLWHLNGFPYGSNNGPTVYVGEKPTVILYIYIDRHAGMPDKKNKTKTK